MSFELLDWDGKITAVNPTPIILGRDGNGCCKVRAYRMRCNGRFDTVTYELWRCHYSAERARRRGHSVDIYYEDRLTLPGQRVDIEGTQYNLLVSNLREDICSLWRRPAELDEEMFLCNLPEQHQKHWGGRFLGEVQWKGSTRRVMHNLLNYGDSHRDKDIKFSRWCIICS